MNLGRKIAIPVPGGCANDCYNGSTIDFVGGTPIQLHGQGNSVE